MSSSGDSEQVTRFALLIVTAVIAGIVFLLTFWWGSSAKKRSKYTFDIGLAGGECTGFGWLLALAGLIITLYVVSCGYCWSYYLAIIIMILVILVVWLFLAVSVYWKDLDSVTNQKVLSVRSTGSLMLMVELTVFVLLLISPSDQGTRSNVVASIAFLPMLLFGFSAFKASYFKNERKSSAGVLTGATLTAEEEEEEM